MKYIYAAILSIAFFAPVSTSAASGFEVTGWLPYWRAATGTADTLPHLDKITEVNPFVYTLKSDGTLYDNSTTGAEPWVSFNAQAKAKGVRVIPTVMSGDRETMHNVLSSPELRNKLIEDIMRTINTHGFDGIDIDFEFKKAETKDYFSIFLRDLKRRLGSEKWLMCTIETRIPLEDRYFGTTIPETAGQYSNDLPQLNTHCDRIRLMAYDQQGVDLKLKSEAGNRLYAPVGDPAWVEKVVNYMSREISKDKMLIGIPTYGYEYAVTPRPGGAYDYDILWTFNPGYATEQAQKFNTSPERAYWGEMAFSYISQGAPSTAPISGRMSALAAAAAASQYLATTNTPTTFRYVVWPDAESIKQRVDLAKRLGVRGVSIFKFDGGQDPNMWNVLSGVAVRDNSTPMAGTPTISRNAIARALKLGSVHDDVKTVQMILNTDSDTRVAASGAGSSGQETTRFGGLTLAAVKKFQVKHGIAKPGQAGYGLVGPKTRAKLNELLQTL